MPLKHSNASALAPLLDGSSAEELIPELVRHGLQQLIELEVTAVLGADRHERSEERLGHRNGYRPRVLTTQVGDIDLRIPKLRSGSFLPSILEPRRRVDQALYAVVMEAAATGVSCCASPAIAPAPGVMAATRPRPAAVAAAPAGRPARDRWQCRSPTPWPAAHRGARTRTRRSARRFRSRHRRGGPDANRPAPQQLLPARGADRGGRGWPCVAGGVGPVKAMRRRPKPSGYGPIRFTPCSETLGCPTTPSASFCPTAGDVVV